MHSTGMTTCSAACSEWQHAQRTGKLHAQWLRRSRAGRQHLEVCNASVAAQYRPASHMCRIQTAEQYSKYIDRYRWISSFQHSSARSSPVSSATPRLVQLLRPLRLRCRQARPWQCCCLELETLLPAVPLLIIKRGVCCTAQFLFAFVMSRSFCWDASGRRAGLICDGVAGFCALMWCACILTCISTSAET